MAGVNVALQKSGPCLAPALGTRAPWRHGAVFVIRGEQQPARAFYAYIGFLNGKAHPAPEAELPAPDIQPDVEPIGPCSAGPLVFREFIAAAEAN